MNKWVEKSIKLAKGRGYLDKLSKVYPVASNIIRELSVSEIEEIKKVFAKRDCKSLISKLLYFKRFPIDDPYIGFLRRDQSAIDRNPKTIKRICYRLFKLGVSGIVSGIQRPKSSSRQFGQHFKNYLKVIGYLILNDTKFLNFKGAAFLKGGDAALKKFAKKHLGYRGGKGLDLIFKKNGKFFIGEAKFISTSGGTQDKSFREIISFVKRRSAGAQHIAIIDGVVWANPANPRGRNLYGSVRRLPENKFVISALLLKEFIKKYEI